MNPAALQEKLRTELGWRIGLEQAIYILARLAAAEQKAFPIFASDARTGHAIRPLLEPTHFTLEAQPKLNKPVKQASSDQFLLFPM
jgi:hypothetical protein